MANHTINHGQRNRINVSIKKTHTTNVCIIECVVMGRVQSSWLFREDETQNMILRRNSARSLYVATMAPEACAGQCAGATNIRWLWFSAI